jgi:hypothetical protein
MTRPPTTDPTPADTRPSGPGGRPPGRSEEDQPLPTIETELSPEQVLERIATLSRRGHMPGFEAGGHGGLFSVAAFGKPFDRAVIAEAGREGGVTRITFRTKLLPLLPWVFAAAGVFTVWPGVWLTHSLLTAYFSGYPSALWVTCAWYLPLAVLPLPWAAVKVWRVSEAAARASAVKAVEKIAAEVDGRSASRGSWQGL